MLTILVEAYKEQHYPNVQERIIWVGKEAPHLPSPDIQSTGVLGRESLDLGLDWSILGDGLIDDAALRVEEMDYGLITRIAHRNSFIGLSGC
jgi:hypothetical protein